MHKKRIIFATLTLLLALLMLGCSMLPVIQFGNGNNSQPTPTAEANEPSTPTAEPAAMAAEGQTEISSAAPTSPCDNLFYPMTENRQWVYEMDGEGESSQMGISVSEETDGTTMVNALSLESGVASQTKIECEDGAILNYPLLSLNFLLGDYLDGDIQTERVSGLFVPAERTLEAQNWQNSWEGEYISRGDIEINYEDENLKIKLSDSPIRLHWDIPQEGKPLEESVTVLAGTFENAIRVHRTVEIDASVSMDADGNNMAVNGTIMLDQTLWFQPHVGLLKQQINQASIKVFGVEYPVILDGTVQLVKYNE